jgi:hypothetical protein
MIDKVLRFVFYRIDCVNLRSTAFSTSAPSSTAKIAGFILIQNVDMREGIESTLTILHHKIRRGIETIRAYDQV